MMRGRLKTWLLPNGGNGAFPGGPWPWIIAFILFFTVFYLSHGERITPDPDSSKKYRLLTGDEPHYLLLAHSIAFDGDIDLYNNRKNKDYEAYYHRKVSGYVKTREFWQPIVKGRLKDAPDEYWHYRKLSVCPPGMPILIAPVYRLGHTWGRRIRYCVVLFFHALAAGTALLMMGLAWKVCQDRLIAFLVGTCLALSAPLYFYTFPIYPDLPAAFTIALCLWLLLNIHQRKRTSLILICALLGLATGFLPSLHSRFWLHAFLITCTAVAQFLRLEKSRATAFLAFGFSFSIVAAGLAYYYWIIFGIPLPVSTYPAFSLKMGLTSGWAGMWLDRNNGLLFYAPISALLFPGAVLLWRKKSLIGCLAVLLIVVNWILTGAYNEWRGGLCPPMRYWVCVMPLFAMPCAACLSTIRHTGYRVFMGITGLAGMALAVKSMLTAGRMFRYSHPVFSFWPWLRYRKWSPVFYPSSDWTAMTMAAGAILLLALFIYWNLWLVARQDRAHTADNSE